MAQAPQSAGQDPGGVPEQHEQHPDARANNPTSGIALAIIWSVALFWAPLFLAARFLILR
jgi:hypothetical protein